jgi:phosphotransferase system enzyme I (PtsP)
MGVEDLPTGRLEGREIIVDGYLGRVFVQPTGAVRDEFERLAAEERELAEGLLERASEPATTLDGVRVPIMINAGLLSDAPPAMAQGVDGVGLYRTELPFLMRERFPGEDEQYEIYRDILASFAPHPVTLRTLDVGGDKPLSYFPVDEDNPFLGWRGIRVTLDHPEIFLTQLRAMLRASRGYENLNVMLPMISSLSEVEEAKALLEQAYVELSEEGEVLARPRLGVMVEVPAAVYLAESLARRVDFLSIGTNDLVQYLLAVDRNNARVADLYHSLHPAVLSALRQVVEGAHRVGCPVSVCGEMAAEPTALPLLLGLGVDALSVNLAGLPRVKEVLRRFTSEQARGLLAEAMALEEPQAIVALCERALDEAGLGGLIRVGKH